MNDRAADVLLYGALLILPLSALIARRPPLRRTMLLAAAWVGIFLVGLVVVGQRERLRLFGTTTQATGSETRIGMAADGHFWADVRINGVHRRMLVDSGASTTALTAAIARAAGLTSDSPFPIVLDTANGRTTAQTAMARRVSVGSVTTTDLPVAISAGVGGTDVLGMNFLSRLQGWRVEGRTLVLTPNPR